ncbi:MAG: polymer-forming cytoskeletal protein [Pseudomonadota bacterium]
MFSKSSSKSTSTATKPSTSSAPTAPKPTAPAASTTPSPAETTKAKPPASILSADLMVKGNLKTTGDVQILGTVEGDVRAHLLTIGEGSVVKGEVVADDVVVNGKVIGRVRGLKVRLTSTAVVEGDIIHKTIAIESGAHFEGSVQRQEDPLSGQSKTRAPAAKAAE